jgi:glycosyltransferase involved in cell wall biosynthesis
VPKFVLIDPSVQDFHGHYCEHAMRVLRAAETSGYWPVLAANRRFRVSQNVGAEVCPVYRYTFWFSLTDKHLLRRSRSCLRAVRRSLIRLKVQLIFSKVGLIWTLHASLRQYLQRRVLTSRFTLPILLLLVGSYLARVVRAGARLLWDVIPFHDYLYRLARGLQQLVGVSALPLRHLLNSQGLVIQSVWTRVKMKQFAADTQRLFRQVPLEAGDCVFITCASVVEVAALARYFRRDPRSSRADWHLMFRHQLYNPGEEKPDEDACRAMRNAFHAFRQSFSGHRVYFYTDTADLAQHYNMLRVFDFRPLPVPVSDEYHSLRRTDLPAPPLQIAYVGDARDEKGYQHMPRIVEDLWARYVASGQVEFLIQSNFSAPEGTPATVIARAQLEALPRDKVHLLTEPLDCLGYRDLVLGADLILLPYTNPTHYFAASSGILTEALAAGTPVIVPEGTWLSVQLTRPIYRYHQELLRRNPVVDTLDGGRIVWRHQAGSQPRELADGRLQLSGRRRRRCFLAVPPTATHLLVSFQPHVKRRGNFVEVVVEQRDDARNPVGEKTCVLGGDNSPISILIELEPDARRLRLGYRNAFNGSLIELSSIRFDFLRSAAPLPLSAVGLVFSRPEELTDAVREVIENYAHYRQTAQEFSSEWVKHHNVRNLIELLVKRSGQAGWPWGGPSERRSGGRSGEKIPRAPKFLTTGQHARPTGEQLCKDPA